MLVDPCWQEHATTNARNGFPWAVWGRRKDVDMPLGLHASLKTEQEAHECAARSLIGLRPRGQWILIVVREPV